MRHQPSLKQTIGKRCSRPILLGAICASIAIGGFAINAQADTYDDAITAQLHVVTPAGKPDYTLDTVPLPQLTTVLHNVVSGDPDKTHASIYVDRIVNASHAKAGFSTKIAGGLANTALATVGGYTDQELTDIVTAALRGFASPANDGDRGKMAAAIVASQTGDKAGIIASAATKAGSGISAADVSATPTTSFTKNYLVGLKKLTLTNSDIANVAIGLSANFTVSSLTNSGDTSLQPKADAIDAVIGQYKKTAGAVDAIVNNVAANVLGLNGGASSSDKDTFVVNLAAKVAGEKNAKANINPIASGLTKSLSASAFVAGTTSNAVDDLAVALATAQPKSGSTIITGIYSTGLVTDADTVAQIAGKSVVAANDVAHADKFATAAGNALATKNDLYEIADGMASAISSTDMKIAGAKIGGALGALVDKNASDVNLQLASIISALTAKIGGNVYGDIQKTVHAVLGSYTKLAPKGAGGTLTEDIEGAILKSYIAGSVAAGVSSTDTTTIAEKLLVTEFKQKVSTAKAPNAVYDRLHAFISTSGNWNTYTYGEVVMGETNDEPI